MIKYVIEEEWLGIIFRDPVTALTNVLIAVTAWWAFRRFRREDCTEGAYSWRWFFFFTGISSLVAVVVHGFSYYTSEKTHLVIWIVMCLLQGFGITFAQRATILEYFPEKSKKVWLTVPVIQFVAFAGLLALYQNYNVAKVHIALGLLPLMFWNGYQHFSGNPTGGGIALGIFVASITAFVHTFKISFGDWFNYNDISHVLLCVSIWLMCKGVLRGAGEQVTVQQ